MKMNFDTVMTDLKGQPVMEPPKAGGPATMLKLSDVTLNALMALDESDNVDVKVKKFKIAMKVSQGGEIELSPEDIVLIKSCIGKFYSPLAVGRAHELLDG